MSELKLSLFGSPCLTRDGAPLHLRSRKCIALLSYLAVTGASHARARLTTLFWPNSDTRRALGALRYTLWLLRSELQNAWLVVDREAIGLDGSERAAVDVTLYRHLLAQCQTHGHPVQETCPACHPLLAEAVHLYGGDFLAGFILRDSPEFDEWQHFEAQTLRQAQGLALERLAQISAAQGSAQASLTYTQRWVALDPLHEPAHRCLMRLYALSGRRADALHQYETLQRILQAELGASPDQATITLYRAIQERSLGQPRPTVSTFLDPLPIGSTEAGKGQGLPSPVTVAPVHHHHLPPEPTPFVGRQAELVQIAQLLADPGCRLLSIVGPGGIGKSRLALRAGMTHVEHFPHGVFFVPLGPVESPNLLSPTILNALDVPLQGSLEPGRQLLRVLGDRQLLLILDNFEHLLEGAALIAEIMGEAPGVKLLVTSRERLNLQEEWLLPLEGMRFPGTEETTRVGAEEAEAIWEGTIAARSASALEEYPAIQLFVQCARRMRPDFSLLTAGASSVARICQLVEGMPLAIELAAPWTRVIPCRDLAREMEESLAVLSSSLHNVPRRHRSMRAAFDHSWGLLSAQERDVLRELSVCRGGFRREAAEAVAMRPSERSASLSMLTTLVDSSWLRATSSGRYNMHPLIRQYCEERLEQVSEDGERTRDRHGEYYTTFLEEREVRLKGRGQKEAIQEILEDIDNVRAAWTRATERGDVEALGRSVESFCLVSQRRGWYREMDQPLDSAAARLRETLERVSGGERARTSPENAAIVLTQLLSWQALHRCRFGWADGALALLEESLALLRGLKRSPPQRRANARAKATLGWVLSSVTADPHKANQLLQEAQAEAIVVGDQWSGMFSAWSLGLNAYFSGAYPAAERYLQEALTVADASGDRWWRLWCMDLLSRILCARGEYRRAEILTNQNRQLSEELGDRVGASSSQLRLGETAAALGKYGLARQHFQASLATARERSDPTTEALALMGQASVASALEDHREARQLLEKALSVAEGAGPWRQIAVLVELGLAHLALGESGLSSEHLRQALALASGTGLRPRALSALEGATHLLAFETKSQRAAELLALILQHPATLHATKVRAQRLFMQLESTLSPAVVASATSRGQALDLEDTLAEVLEECAAAMNGR